MNDKPWRPAILHPQKTFMHEAYGITEERRLELSAKMDAMFQACRGSITAVHYIVDKLVDLSETKEEYAWCVVTHMWFMAKKNHLL